MNKNISTIRRKITLPIILLILAALCLFGCVACAHEFLTEEDVKKDFPIAVIFDYNGGNVEGEATTKIRVKENSYVPEPGNEQLSNLAAPTRAKYTLKGFFLAKTDEDGKPIRGEDGKPVLDREWDFKTDKPDADITLFADWWDNYEMILHYGDNLTKSIDIPRNPDGTPTAVTAADARVLNYTFIEYYKDTQKKEPITFPHTFEFEQGKLKVDIYSDSLEGTFRIIRRASDLTGFSFLNTTNICLLADIDMNEIYDAGKKFSLPATYSGQFLGRNHTISNLVVTAKASGPRDSNFGLFNIIDSGANISDVTFENVTLNYDLSNLLVSDYYVGLLAGRVRDEATVKNVHVSGTLNYSVVAGYDGSKLNVHDMCGIVIDGAKMTDVTVDVTAINGAAVAYTDNRDYAVYVKYTKTAAGTVAGDVYGLASRNSGTSKHTVIKAKEDGIVKVSDGQWTFTDESGKVYNITVSVSGSNITSTVSAA